jgi:hypothetical protein
MGYAASQSSRLRKGGRLGVGGCLLALAAVLAWLWCVPPVTRISVPLEHAPLADGLRRVASLPALERSWTEGLFWRSSLDEGARPVVRMGCGKFQWTDVGGELSDIAREPGGIRLDDGYVLHFSLPDGASCNNVDISWANAPNGWVGISAILTMGLALVLLLPALRRSVQWLLIALVCGLATGLAVRSFEDGYPTGADGDENFVMMSNLATTGVMEYLQGTPTNMREPLPIATGAAAIWLGRCLPGYDHLDEAGRQDFDRRAAKFAGLAWMFIGLISTWALAWIVTRTIWVAIAATWMTWVLLFADPGSSNTLYTEIHAGALITAASLLLVIFVRSPRWTTALLCGLVIGLLCLTKALFFYIALSCLAGAATLSLILPLKESFLAKTRRTGLVVILLIGVSLVCFPWMLRNKMLLDTWSITQRGGVVLMVRALTNQMTADEWRASWWIWGPTPYRQLVANTSLGARITDFRCGGRYVRLAVRAKSCPDGVFYHMAFAERQRLLREYRRAHHPNASVAADRALRQLAAGLIVGDLPRHLWCTPPVVWRGLWFVQPSPDGEFVPAVYSANPTYVGAGVSLVLWSSLGVTLLVGLFRRSAVLVGMTVLPVALLVANALLSHNIPRYSVPAIPVMCASLALIMWWLGRMLVRLVRRTSQPIRVSAALNAQSAP